VTSEHGAAPGARLHVAVVGGGPAGLMAAEVLAAGGAQVHLYDAMPSVGRKFLLAGKGGLNLTHSEPFETFVTRYGSRQAEVAGWLQHFGPQALRDWALGLGVETFVGTSGRVFPTSLKAAPLLRAWLHRLRTAGVHFHMRHRWVGWQADDPPTRLRFAAPQGEVVTHADAVVLALGGASWARLGSDGAWVPWLQARGVAMAPLQSANCGFDIGWSEHFASRHAGAPLKSVRLAFEDSHGRRFDRIGECVVTATGVEGSLVYAASALLRDQITAAGSATCHLDLQPSRDVATLTGALARGRGARSLSNHLREHAGIAGAKAGLLREGLDAGAWAALAADPAAMARRIKAVPLHLKAARPMDEAISTAGGVCFEAMDDNGMLRALPGVWCAGEMLDWEAPTGGYLLTACMAAGRRAGSGVLAQDAHESALWATGIARGHSAPG
jgi:uncharacterized flavoprotein (TIGR03862 family)